MGGAGRRGTDVDDLGAYVTATLLGYAPVYRPEDMYTGTELAALTALDSGITTMLDFAHNSRTPAHSDAAVQALVDTGIRGVHAAMGPHFGEWDRQWPADLARLQDQFGSGLLTFRLAALATEEIAGPDPAYGPEIARLAKELGMGVSVDAIARRRSRAPDTTHGIGRVALWVSAYGSQSVAGVGGGARELFGTVSRERGRRVTVEVGSGSAGVTSGRERQSGV